VLQVAAMNRKGQLTIFIIIGIALLFSAALVIYIKQSVTQYKPPIELLTEQVPTELRPLQAYVTTCVEEVAKEAIIKAGMQGGYIDTSTVVINERDPTAGEGIPFSPGSDVKLPYWYYMKSANTCTDKCEFASKQPTLYRTGGAGNSLEDQIGKYVEEKTASCLRNFAAFKAQGFEVQQGQIQAFTTIAKTDVFVQVDFPLTVEKDGRVETISKFAVRLPVNIGKLYDLATELAEKEIRTNYLGHMAMNLIDVYSSIDEEKLPPIADATFERGGFKKWLKGEVKGKIEELLMIHTPALQAAGTSNFQGNFYKGNNKMAEGLYSLFILPLNHSYRANAEFTYLAWWPIYLEVTPSEGEIIKPESVSGFHALLSAFGMNQYRFAYDVSFPVLITLSDPDAFGGEGFVFQFAIESNLRNNAQMKSDTRILQYAGRPSQTLVCNPDNYKSGEVTIDVSDSITKAAVDEALIYFSFGKESCFIGETKIVQGKGTVKTKMPVGIGTLIISKEDYISKTITFGSKLDVEQALSVELDRFVMVNISVSRIPVISGKNTTVDYYKIGQHAGLYGPPGSGPHEERTDPAVTTETTWAPMNTKIPNLKATQRAVISLIRIPDHPAQEQHVAAVEIIGSANRTQPARLVPGKYKIIGNLFDYQRTVVPEKEECFDDDWYDSWGFGEQKCEKIPAITFNVFPQGGVSIDEYTLAASSLQGAKEIVIYLFEAPSGFLRESDGTTNLEHKDLEQQGKAESYSKNYPSLITPEIKK
jgi:hypothetical protein